MKLFVRRRSIGALVSMLFTALAPLQARAQVEQPPDSTAHPQLTYNWWLDGGIVLLSSAVWIGSEVGKSHIAPSECRWCARNGFDDAVTNALAWRNIQAAGTVGDITASALTPLVTAGMLALAANSEDRLGELPVDLLVMAEALTLSQVLNQVVKMAAGRERPFVADLPLAEKGTTSHPADNNLSFYSSHSDTVFALAVSAGTIAHLRGYEAEPYVWAVGLPLAAFVAYSRIGAKKHYLSDVLVGSAAGAAFGFAVPWFLHRAASPLAITLVPAPGGVAIAGAFY
jgi:membrane-associated phospholipid phosphatase